MENFSYIVPFFIYLIIFIGIILLLRKPFCWYWKINENLKIQNEQLKLQKDTFSILEKLLKQNDIKQSIQNEELINPLIPLSYLEKQVGTHECIIQNKTNGSYSIITLDSWSVLKNECSADTFNEIKNYLKFNEIIIQEKKTGRFSKISLEDWNKLQKK